MIRPSQPVSARFLAGFGALARPRTQVARVALAGVRAAALTGIVSLVAFHAWLLWDRLAGGDLLDPVVAFRWTAAALLISALVALRRLGVPLVRGRQSLIVWLLVALLHWNVGGPPATQSGADRSAQSSVIFVLPSTAATALVGLGLLLATLASRRRPSPTFACLCTVEPLVDRRLASGWRLGETSRAPPLSCA